MQLAYAPVLLARRYLPGMAARRRGGLVVMSSATGLQGVPGLSVYAASKSFGAVRASSGLAAQPDTAQVDDGAPPRTDTG